MLEYEWNNMLHNQIERIFVSTLEGDSQVLKKSVGLWVIESNIT